MNGEWQMKAWSPRDEVGTYLGLRAWHLEPGGKKEGTDWKLGTRMGSRFAKRTPPPPTTDRGAGKLSNLRTPRHRCSLPKFF